MKRLFAPKLALPFASKLALPLVLAITGCGPADNDPGPGGVTVGEARALDEAAEMVEAKRLSPEQAADLSEAEPETDAE